MENIISNCLKKGNLTNTKELANLLNINWNEELIRNVYPIAISNLLRNSKVEIIYQLIGLEGKTVLSKIDDINFLFEDIDIWIHEVYATEALMIKIVEEMNKLIKVG